MFKAIKKIASLFSSGNKQPETQDTPIKLPGELEPSAEWLIKEVYGKIMENIEASSEFKKTVLEALYEDKQTGGGSRIFKKYINNDLIFEDWIWPEFDYWYKIFKNSNEWPHTWTEYLYEEPDELPISIEDSLHYLTVQEIKVFLKENKLTPKPMPKNKSGWETAICENGDWALLKLLIIKKHTAYKDIFFNKRRKDKLNLLFHYFAQSIHGRLRYYQLQDLMSDLTAVKIGRIEGIFARSDNEKLTIEQEFVQKFNNGEISDYPPYFPGCSVRVFTKRAKR
jgi:hypothetical protein